MKKTVDEIELFGYTRVKRKGSADINIDRKRRILGRLYSLDAKTAEYLKDPPTERELNGRRTPPKKGCSLTKHNAMEVVIMCMKDIEVKNQVG